jgi:hypothetical protein
VSTLSPAFESFDEGSAGLERTCRASRPGRAAGPQGPQGPGVRYVLVDGQQTFATVAGVGGVTASYFGGTTGQYGLQFTTTPPGNTGETLVWFDDSLAGTSFDTRSGVDVITKLNPGTGTRHVVLRASNASRSATWDIFFQGAGSTCKISIEMPAAASLSAASVTRALLGKRVARSGARVRKGH